VRGGAPLNAGPLVAVEDLRGSNAHAIGCAAPAGRSRRTSVHGVVVVGIDFIGYVVDVGMLDVGVVVGGGSTGPVVNSMCEISLQSRPEPIRVIVTVVVPSPETV
jgi:hypothetical protein